MDKKQQSNAMESAAFLVNIVVLTGRPPVDSGPMAGYVLAQATLHVRYGRSDGR